jgi:diacylglycerol O-acyltransferase
MRARKEPSLPITDAIASALNLLPASYLGGVFKHIDFLASNVPGIPVPVYLAGSKITGFFTFGPPPERRSIERSSATAAPAISASTSTLQPCRTRTSCSIACTRASPRSPTSVPLTHDFPGRIRA